MTASRIEYLFNQYVKNECSPTEKQELMVLLAEPGNEAIFRSLIQTVIEDTGTEMQFPDQKASQMLAGILQSGKAVTLPMKNRNAAAAWIRVAAAVLLVIIAGASYRMLRDKQEMRHQVASEKQQPLVISPGGDKASLTMADGSTLVLDSVPNGKLAESGNTAIQKQQGTLIYGLVSSSVLPSEPAFNLLTVPRGGQYHVVLSDGTQVWLNAASSLRFPTAFTGATREVELTGEAYFEVAKNKKLPFEVKVNTMRVQVLGTHFNINAYSEEQAIKTSLLEGSVQVNNGAFSNRIKPGEQAIVNNNDGLINISTADMDAVMAWKNGLFEFQGADIATIMRQIARWYDVEIVFTAKPPARLFEGKINRNAQLAEVLRILELSNIKFRVEGKKIIVQ